MPERISAWAVYDVFVVKDGEQIFLAVVSDTAWKLFCDAFGYTDLFNDPRLTSNNDRVLAREWLLPNLRERLKNFSAQELSEVFEKNSLPYAPITAPHELLDDPHLNATGGLAPMTLNDGRTIDTVLLPLSMNQERLKVRQNAPNLGEHNESLLSSLGYNSEEIQKLSHPNEAA
jgi:crotonobetainyl-CoA:carnitine CoA-transferase CaiB-like acyl-CoA transferase